MPDNQRALLEAALEASTLLDAWVTPDGSLIAGDVSLLPAVRHDRTLAEALTPVANDRVAWDTVDAVLRSVALDEEHAEVAVFADGRYRLGAAHGSHRKDAAQFIGSSARAANRQARITVLETELAMIDAACGELASEIERIAERLERTREEERAFPEDALAPILAGARNLDVAQSREQHAVGEHADFEQRAERDAAGASAAANIADAHAREHRLPLPGTQPDLDTLDKALRAYARDIVITAGAARDLARDRAHSEVTAGTFTELDTLVQQLDGDTRRLQEHAGARRAAYETARELHGAEVEVAQNRLRDAKKHRADLADERRDAESAVKTAIREAGEALGELRQARSELTLAKTRRGTAFGALVECERADLFRLALHEHAPEDHAQAAGWPLERALDVAGVCATALDAPAANRAGTSDGAAPGLASGAGGGTPAGGAGRAASGTVLSARGRWSLTSSTGCSAPTWRTVAT